MAVIRTSDRLSGGGAPAIDYGWDRPNEWLPMPVLADGDDQVSLLVAVFDSPVNRLSFEVTTSSGNYLVDLGDGNGATTVASGQQFNGLMDWADYAPSTLYSDHGYRQAIVTITPEAGQSLTDVNFGVSTAGISDNSSNFVLEAVCAGSNIASVGMYGSTRSEYLRAFSWVGACNLTTAFQMFRQCASLVYVDMPDTALIQNMQQMYYQCTSLHRLPDHDMSSCTIIREMCQNNTSMISMPVIDCTAVTNAYRAFFASGISEIELTNCDSITNGIDLIWRCYQLTRASFQGLTTGGQSSDCRMEAAELNAFFASLGTSNGTRTIDVSGNPGAATCDPTIATAKGYTVVTA